MNTLTRAAKRLDDNDKIAHLESLYKSVDHMLSHIYGYSDLVLEVTASHDTIITHGLGNFTAKRIEVSNEMTFHDEVCQGFMALLQETKVLIEKELKLIMDVTEEKQE